MLALTSAASPAPYNQLPVDTMAKVVGDAFQLDAPALHFVVGTVGERGILESRSLRNGMRRY
ncbi:unannotated protein [freshwater metagenome]|uniref:Unannotated protein n=1 Tax=freshwater metagenome TaxID=449393 RepID=A0A6J5ZH42_9ZZZZ